VHHDNQQQVQEIKLESVVIDTLHQQQEQHQIELRDRKRLKPPDRYAAQSFITNYVET